MRKFSKEDKQKIAVGVIFLIGIVYVYFDVLLTPMQKGAAAAAVQVEAIEPSIRSANSQITAVRNLETRAPEAEKVIASVKVLIPEGEPVAWFPSRVSGFFRKHGIEQISIRKNSETTERDLPGFRKITWAVDIPKAPFHTFGKALAQWENEEPLVEITNMYIDAGREDATKHRIQLTVDTLVRQ